MNSKSTHHHRIIVIGAGPGGMCTAIKLREAGIEDFVILEKAGGVGGTWWHNRYPGAECDVKSHLYSFSFEIKRDWSRPFAGQAEILDYMQHVAEKYAILPYCRFNQAVSAARWDDEATEWVVETATGEAFRAPFLVSAMGMFNELQWPDIPGLDDFEGKLFHSARWDHDYDLAGKRVAVIGSAASAVQFVPEIAPKTAALHVFQRTANWVAPKDDAPYTQEELEHFVNDPDAIFESRRQIYEDLNKFILFNDPELQAENTRLALENIEVVKDPAVRQALVPTHPFGCKRPLFSNLYYPTFNLPQVELVTDRIERLGAHGVVTADGRERAVDCVIVATGFQVSRYLSAIEVTGRDGVRIDDAWSDGAQAYLGITTHGFPNLFMLYGPNTNNGSILFMIERQVGYIVRQIERVMRERLAWIDVRNDVEQRYNEVMQQDIKQVEVWQANCGHYYNARSGRMVTQWPHDLEEYTARTTRDDTEAYDSAPRAAAAAG
ncbi:MAG: NAD(P)/FAD-dependent oxidoreductase [Gammaproteobacteria bacterium]|nr:NAD(P)/FAD-dependent oxidoreductase [Gammaproteobacteria bacterium]